MSTFVLSFNNVNFFASLVKWKTGMDLINHQNCFAVNFGFDGDIPIPSFSFNANTNLTRYELEKYHNCTSTSTTV